MRFFQNGMTMLRQAVSGARFGAIGAQRLSDSHSAKASTLKCRNCGSQLDYTDIACPACRRKVVRFTLST